MFKIFSIGAVQEPSKKKLTHYFPKVKQFKQHSKLIDGLSGLIAQEKNLEDLQNEVRQNWIGKGPKSGEEVFETVAAIDAKLPKIAELFELIQESGLPKALEEMQSTDRSQLDSIISFIPSLYATMTGWLVLNEQPRVIERARDLTKVIALLGHMTEKSKASDKKLSDNTGNAEDVLLFAQDFLTKAQPDIEIILPKSRNSNWHGAESPQSRPDEHADAPVVEDYAAQISATQKAIDEIETAMRRKQRALSSALPSEAELQRQLQAITLENEKVQTTGKLKAGKPIRSKIDLGALAKQQYAELLKQQSQRVLTLIDTKRISADSKELIAQFVDVKEGFNPEHANEELRRHLKKLRRKVPKKPRENPRVIFAHGHMIEFEKNIFDEITCNPPDLPCHCDLLTSLDKKHGTFPQLFILGTGKAFRIDTKFSKYIKGELVHTEPVLANSQKKSTFRMLNRTDSFQETFTSREEEQEREATTDDRFKMEKEIESDTKSEAEANFSATMTASYGTASLTANAGGSSSTATQDKVKNAQEISQNKTSKAVSKLKTKNEERNSVRRISENERNSSFLVKGKPASYTAFYHAIDKEFTHQLVCIGTRLVIRVCMQEFMAPLLHCLMTGKGDEESIPKPIRPDAEEVWIDNKKKRLQTFEDIQPENYDIWTSHFEVSNIPPPPGDVTVADHAHRSGDESEAWQLEYGNGGATIQLPQGFVAHTAVAAVHTSNNGVSVSVGGNGYQGVGWQGTVLTFNVLGQTDKMPWSYLGQPGHRFTIDIVVYCKPSSIKMDEWRIKVYDAIWSKYRQELSDYENKVQTAKIEAGIEISGRNPRQNEVLVRQELMKMVLGATFPQFYYRGFNAMKFGVKCDANGNKTTTVIPEPDFMDAKEEAPWVTFMGKLYEFENMTFDFKPYFFGNRAKWCTLRKLTDVDPRFELAMTAGYVTIDIPVSLGMEDAFFWYLKTGQIWKGNGMPVTGDPLFQALALEIKDGQNPQGEPDGTPWKTILPTNLVMVSDDVPDDLAL